MKPLAWSYSGLSQFVNCPRQFEAVRVSKSVKESQGEAQVWGEWVHKQFENRQRDGTPLPPELASHEWYMQRLEALPGEPLVEQKVALNMRMEPCGFFDPGVWNRGVIDFAKIHYNIAKVCDYKGLPTDTEIPTPAGFVRMADLIVGDTVFGSNGQPCTVHTKSGVHHRPCYRVLFDDTSSVVCDNVHLWPLVDGSVVPVTSLKRSDKIKVAGVARYTTQSLPIDPYVFGLWLADGKHSSSEITKPDTFVWDEIVRRGYAVGSNTGRDCPTRSVLGIRRHLHCLGVYKNKHIPDAYKYADEAQRVDLIRGLMDGDGSVNSLRHQVVFQNVSKRLSDDVKEVVQSLGHRVSQGVTKYSGFGVSGISYPLSWRPAGFNPFLLPRKRSKVGAWGWGRSDVRRVVSVVEEPSVPTQCIGVDSPDNTYLCTRQYIPTHNTGKVKPDLKQLALFSLFIFHTYPQVTKVDTTYYWTVDPKSPTEAEFLRGRIPEIWAKFLPDLKQYNEAFKHNIWQPRQSGLCAGWCPVTECEFWKPKRSK